MVPSFNPFQLSREKTEKQKVFEQDERQIDMTIYKIIIMRYVSAFYPVDNVAYSKKKLKRFEAVTSASIHQVSRTCPVGPGTAIRWTTRSFLSRACKRMFVWLIILRAS